MADNKLNTQLQAIQARLDSADEDRIAMKAGIAQLVDDLSKNPIVAPSTIKSKLVFNFTTAGDRMLKKLLGLLPIDEFKRLQKLDAAGMLDGLESRISAEADQMAQTVANELEAAATAQVKALEDQANALVEEVTSINLKEIADNALNDVTQQLETAISEGASAEVIEALESEVSSATAAAGEAGERLGAAIAALATSNAAVAQAVAFLGGLKQAASAVTGFMDTLEEIAKGKTDSAVVQGTPPNTNPETQETASEVVNKIV
jgi:hypothetical protein